MYWLLLDGFLSFGSCHNSNVRRAIKQFKWTTTINSTKPKKKQQTEIRFPKKYYNFSWSKIKAEKSEKRERERISERECGHHLLKPNEKSSVQFFFFIVIFFFFFFSVPSPCVLFSFSISSRKWATPHKVLKLNDKTGMDHQIK